MKKVIVTCLFGDYDELNPAPKYKDWDTILFTDSIPDDPKGWTVHLVEPSGDPKKQSRYNKIMLHKVLPDYYLYCYMDANMVLTQEPPSNPIWGQHPYGHTIYQEAQRIVKLGKDNITEINRQMNFYRGNRMRGTDKITMNGFFVRRNTPEINHICEVWWEQVKQFSYRDQLSLPFVFEATNRKMENIVRTSEIRRYFKIVRAHTPKAEPRPIPNVHHITAGRGDKDIGKAINDIVRGVDDDDWICLRDIDSMPTNHREFFKQCEAIAQAGEFRVGVLYDQQKWSC